VQIPLVAAAAILLVAGLIFSQSTPVQSEELQWLLGLAIIVTAALAGGHLAGRLGHAAVLEKLVAVARASTQR
jgi:hypothetical protein